MESTTNNSKKKNETRKRKQENAKFEIHQKPYDFKQFFVVYGLYND